MLQSGISPRIESQGAFDGSLLWSGGRCSAPLPRVSENQRFLVTEKGGPFFWLDDTPWALLQKCVRGDSADKAWAWAMRRGRNENDQESNGVVFAGVGISIEPTSFSIPHLIEEGLKRP